MHYAQSVNHLKFKVNNYFKLFKHQIGDHSVVFHKSYLLPIQTQTIFARMLKASYMTLPWVEHVILNLPLS